MNTIFLLVCLFLHLLLSWQFNLFHFTFQCKRWNEMKCNVCDDDDDQKTAVSLKQIDCFSQSMGEHEHPPTLGNCLRPFHSRFGFVWVLMMYVSVAVCLTVPCCTVRCAFSLYLCLLAHFFPPWHEHEWMNDRQHNFHVYCLMREWTHSNSPPLPSTFVVVVVFYSDIYSVIK